MTKHKFICITDLEATCWDNGNGGRRQEMETIEIGSVLVETSCFEQVAEFQRFIKPVRVPILSDFCKMLTTITQDQVDRAQSFPDAFKEWIDFMNQVDDVVLASWGQYDYNQIAQDCAFHQLPFPFKEHVNIKQVVAAKMGWKPNGVRKAVNRLGLTFEGTAHRGIDDAKNIHKIVQKCYI